MATQVVTANEHAVEVAAAGTPDASHNAQFNNSAEFAQKASASASMRNLDHQSAEHNMNVVSGEQFEGNENLKSLYSQQVDGMNQIEIQRRLVGKPKNDKSVSIAKKFAYDTVGSNGIFQASPSVIKFAGFETNKTHTMKLKLINNSPAP